MFGHMKAEPILRVRAASALGLPMPRVETIAVFDWLIEHTDDLRIDLGGRMIPCRSGEQLGSPYGGPDGPGRTLDYLPHYLLETVLNLEDFARVLVLDKWTCNSDGKQASFRRKTPRSQRFAATFIDQGYCFNAGEWSFPDCPLRGVHADNCVYKKVAGWGAFESTLTRAEQMDANEIWRLAADIPEESYEGDTDTCIASWKRSTHAVRSFASLISEFRKSNRNPFPNWRD
jgi:hypothetical protein